MIMTNTSYHRFECDTNGEVDYDTHLADQLKVRDKTKKFSNIERIRPLHIIE